MAENSGREFSLRQLQDESRAWTYENFGNRPGWQPVLGVAEEMGELAHAFLKRAQGIRGSYEENTEKIKDAAADIIVFLADVANTEGFDLQDTLEEVWNKVKQRNWRKYGASGGGA